MLKWIRKQSKKNRHIYIFLEYLSMLQIDGKLQQSLFMLAKCNHQAKNEHFGPHVQVNSEQCTFWTVARKQQTPHMISDHAL